MSVLVDVTEADKTGGGHGAYVCPTARAIARALALPRVRLSRCSGGMAVQLPPPGQPEGSMIDRPFIRLPNAAWAFETAFDRVVEVWGDDEPGRQAALAPYSFTLEVPA